MGQKQTILLYGLKSGGLIIPSPSGVIYQNQTGGYYCLQDSAEGVFVPLFSEPTEHYADLYKYFYKGKWGGYCTNGIDEETADFIDATFLELPGHHGIKVDRTRLAESHEAWVYVTVADPSSTGLLEGFGPLQAIFTWPNSD